MGILNKSEQEKYYASIEKHRKTIPDRYNQIKLMNYLLDEDLDHYISISNRADGKSFNYLHVMCENAINFGMKFILLARHYTVRFAYQDFLIKLFDKSHLYNSKDLGFLRSDFFITVYYKDKQVCLISDLNQATDLKYHSNHLEDFPIMVYDEFLALEGDYLPDEWERLKTIYASINRKDEEDMGILKIPKILYLGNAVNFSSPVLSALDMFNSLENHQMNTVRKYGNIILEMNKNEYANEERNLRAFNEEVDPLTMAEFKTNSFNIITENQRMLLKQNARFIIVKLRDSYLKITFNPDNNLTMLGVIGYSKGYDFNMQLKDNTKDSFYLDEKFFDEEHTKKYKKDFYLFDNNYTKDFITHGFAGLDTLKITKIIAIYMSSTQQKSNFEIKEEQYKDNYIEQTKKNLVKNFLS